MTPVVSGESPEGGPSEEIARLRRRLARERTARAEVEQIAETKIRELYERQQELTMLEQVAGATNAMRSVDEAFRFAVDQVCRFLRWPVGHAIRRPDHNPRVGEVWHLADAARMEPFVTATRQMAAGPAVSLTDLVISRREAIWVPDVTENEGLVRRQVAREVGLAAAVAAPVWVGNEIVGVFEFFSHVRLEPNPRLLALIAQVGVHVGRVVERERADALMLDHQDELERLVSERTASLTVANRELASFAYSVSHDLRAPLRAIHGFSQALVEDCAERLDADGLNYLERVCRATERMSELIDGMLLLSRVTRDELTRGEVDLSALARISVAELRAGEPERDVRVEISDDLHARGDERMFSLMLANLIGNAWKFTRRAPQGQISLTAEQLDGETVFSVADNGAGFDMAYADSMFGAFQRLHSAAEYEGTGIGLATVHRIVSRHGGRIWARAEPGAGATFSFTLATPETSR